MNQSSSDIELFERLRTLDNERSRLLKRYEMSCQGSAEQSSFLDAIQRCDREIDSLIGTTSEEQEKNLKRISESVKMSRNIQQEHFHKRHQYETGIQQVGKGLGCSLIAALVSGGAYLAAGPGDHYIIFWGAMAWGGWILLQGVANIIASKR